MFRVKEIIPHLYFSRYEHKQINTSALWESIWTFGSKIAQRGKKSHSAKRPFLFYTIQKVRYYKGTYMKILFKNFTFITILQFLKGSIFSCWYFIQWILVISPFSITHYLVSCLLDWTMYINNKGLLFGSYTSL